MNLAKLLALLKQKPKPRPIYVGDTIVGYDDGLPNSVKIDKDKLVEALAPIPWLGRIMPFNFYAVSDSKAVATGNLDSIVLRIWMATRWLEIMNTMGAANANQAKAYLVSMRCFRFGIYRIRAYTIGTRGAGRSSYPLMFETPIGGHAVSAPSGDYAGAVIICDAAGSTQIIAGYAGSVSYTTITGWDPSVESELKIDWSSTKVDFYTDGTLRGSLTTNVPQCAMPYCHELRQDGSATAYADHYIMRVRDFEILG
ncbi:MAG: hypothetical protein QXK47_04055 [Candidatus Bathyarchaeia archaeon]